MMTAETETARAELAEIVGPGNICSDPRYLEDYRRILSPVKTLVVKPKNPKEVTAVVKWAAARGFSLVPQGGNTGLVGGSVPQDEKQIVVSAERMRRIRTLEKDKIVAEAGCLLADARAAADARGRQLPLKLASEGSCAIGGAVSTNAGGANVTAYGSIRRLVLGLEAVTARGELVSSINRPSKDNSGYRWSECFIGAEGTLGIITAAELRLVPAPATKFTAWLAVDEPVAAGSLLQERLYGFIVALEVMNSEAMELALRYLAEPPPLPRGRYNLLVEVAAHCPDLAVGLERVLQNALVACGGEAVIARSGRQAAAMWETRDCISDAQRAEGFSIKHDIALPIAALKDFLANRPKGWRLICFGHLGDGSLHYNLQCPKSFSKKEFLRARKRQNEKVYSMVTKLGGSISAEHGIGRYHKARLSKLKPAAEYALLKRLKAALDPQNIMNPGVLLD